MKPLSQFSKLGFHLAAYLVFAILPLQAAIRIWNGAGADDNWSTGGTGGNWTNATLALSGDTPLFGGTARRDNVNDLTGLTVTGIEFISTTDGNHFRISGNMLVLGGSITTSASGGTIQDEIALGMQLNGNRSINTASGHHILVSGVISQDVTNRTLTKLGPGILLLSGENSYAGGTNIDSGTVRLMASDTIPDTGTVTVQRATNAGSTHGVLDLNGYSEGISSLILGSLTTTAANAGQTVSVISSSGSANLTLLGTGGITYRTGSSGFENGQALISTGIVLAGDRTITLGDVPALDEELVISGVVSQTGGNRNLTKNGLGTLRLSSNLNSFTGQMRINSGILSVSHLADSGAGNTSPIGTGNTTASIRLGSENNTGTLLYDGTGHSTNRPITLGNGVGAGGGSILSNGTGAISFTAATFLTTINSLDSRTLTLGGTNTAANLISGLIRDNGGALGAVNLAKTGSGTWKLDGANTFTGNVQVSSGRLTLGHPHALGFGGSALTAGITSVATGAVLDLNGQVSVLERISIQGEGSGQGALVSDSGSATLASGIAAVQVNASGTYATPPTVDFTGGGGTGAAATAQLGLSQASLEITAGGSGYTSSPVVNISGGGGSGATATATLTAGAVTAITLTHPGTGYTSAPTIGFSGGGGTGATAVANASQFQLIGITITQPGSGYTSAPNVTFSHGDSTAVAVISGVHLEADAAIGGSGQLAISTPITGVAGASLTKRGAGTVTLTAPSGHDGSTTVVAGTLTMSSSTSNNLLPDSPALDIRAGATLDVSSLGTSPALHLSANQTLKGTGTITGKTVVSSNATLAPGDGPGILSTGEVEIEAGGVLSITLNGTTPGTGHSQLSVTGAVTLTGATLALTGTHTPVDGQSFIIISNDDTDGVVGTFAGLAEGDRITNFLGSDLDAIISYTGGSGNDVVLTAVENSPPTDITLTPASIAENNAPNATVGTLAAVDADVGQTHTFTKVTGMGDTDNASFSISGSNLILIPSADFETKSSYSVRVRADDGAGGLFEKALTVAVTNVYEGPSDLDSTFNLAGKVTTNLGGNEAANCVAIQTDGKIVVAGTSNSSGSGDFMVARYLEDGTPDASFGTGGVVLTDLSGAGSADLGRRLAIQTDGKIVVVGETSAGTGGLNFALARYLDNGTLDSGFGTGGLVVLDGGGGMDDGLNAITLQTDGKIVVAGYSWSSFSGGTRTAVVLRFLGTGALDSSFGTGGSWGLSFGGSRYSAGGVAVDGSGRIVVAGFGPQPNWNGFVARLTASGSTDTSFNGGVQQANFGAFTESGFNAVRLQSDGRIVVAGNRYSSGAYDPTADFALSRYLDNGTLDTSFGTAGMTTTDRAGKLDNIICIALDVHDRIIAAGIQQDAAEVEVFGINRYTRDGILDTTFGTGGRVLTTFGAVTGNRAAWAALDADGGIVAAGNAGSDIAVVRYMGGPPAPEMVVAGNSTLIADGDATPATADHTDFGSALIAGGTVARTFTITNLGDAELNLIGTPEVEVGGTHATDFTVTLAPSTPVAEEGGSTIFQVTFAPGGLGLRTATISIANDDEDETPYNFSIQGTGLNSTPTDITLTPASIAENNVSGAVVGVLAAVDADVADTHTFTLVSGAGSTDNASFEIDGEDLKLNAVADFETKNSYSLRVQADDGKGGVFEKALTVTITDVNEAPSINNTTAKYLTVGGGASNLNAMRLMRLNSAGTAIVSSTALPSNTTDAGSSTRVAYNPTSGQMILRNSHFHLPTFLSSGTLTVTARSGLDNNSPWLAHLPSGKFLTVRRNGSLAGPVQTFTPSTNTITDGGQHPGGIPEASWYYDGFLYNAEEGLSVRRIAVAADGSTTGTMSVVSPNPILGRSIPHGDVFYTETSRMVADPADGTALLSTGHGMLYLFDLDDAPTPGGYISRNVHSFITTSSGGFTADLAKSDVFGLAFDPDTQAFYVQGGLRNASYVGGGDFLLRVTKTGDVTVLAQELAGETIYGTNADTGLSLALATVTPNVFTLAENSANGTVVGTALATDVDAGTVFSDWMITGGNTGGAFAIHPSTGVITVADSAELDYETVTSFTLTVTVSDGTNTSAPGTVTVNLTDLIENVAPTDIILTPASIAENNAANATVGTLAAVDADVGQTHTFTLVTGMGDTDNGSFSISGSNLILIPSADFETKSSYSVRVQANDGAGGVFAEELTVTVTDVNDAPVVTGGPVELSPIYDYEATSVLSILSILADASVDYQDEDSGALAGVAVVAASGAGVWQYSATGAVWADVGTVSDSAALLLPESYLLRYTPAYPGPDGGETAALTLRGWDLTGGTAGSAGTKVNASVQGGTAPFSIGTVALSLAVQEDDRLPTVSDVEINEASPYAVFEVGGAAGQLLTLALGNDAVPATADATITSFTLETLNTLGTAWVAYTPGSQVAVPASGELLVRVSTSSEQDAVAEGVEFYTLVAAALAGDSSVGLGSIRDDDAGAIFLASNLTATPNDPTDDGYPVLDDDVVKYILWGEQGSLPEDSMMDATLPTVDATYPLVFEGMGAGLFDVSMIASGMTGAGLKRIGGQPAWSLTASSGGAKALVNFRFFKTGSTTELKHLKNIVFRIEDAEAGEELSGFSYWDGHGNKVPVLWNNTAIFSYSHTPRFSSSNSVVENTAPLESLTQAGKWVQVDLRGLQVTGIEFSHRKRSSSAGSVVITHLAGQIAPDALEFGGEFSPLQVKANAANLGTVPDYRSQATWVGASGATVSQTPAPGTQLPLGVHEISLTLDDGSGVVAVQGFDLLIVAPKQPLLVVTTPTAATTVINGLSTYTVSGTVLDREGVGMSKVEVIHNGTLLTATLGAPGTSPLSWSLSITPSAGLNTLAITAEDSTGVRSLTLERSFTFTRQYALALTTEPTQGSITLKTSVARSTVLLSTSGATKYYSVLPGVSLTLTAAPKAGYVFSHWSGIPTVAQSAGNVVTLIMPTADDAAITAHFVSNPFLPPVGASNSFQGLLRPVDAADTANDTVAMISGTLATSGTFSGKVMVGGLTHSFAATFQGDGSSTFTVAKVKVSSLPLPNGRTLSLTFSSGNIQATLVKAGITSTGTLQRGIYSATAKVPQALLNRKTSAALALKNQGFYTAAMPSKIQSPPRALTSYPQGDSYTTLTLKDDGTLSLSGVLADGSTLTATSLLVLGDEVPVFVQLNTPGSTSIKGASLSGTLTLQPGSTSDVTGTDLLWLRPSVTQLNGTTTAARATQLYTAGWPSGITLDLVGAQYDTSTPVQTILSLPLANTTTGNAQLDFMDGKLSADISVTDFYISGNTVAKIPATNKSFTLVISAPKATFSGTFTPNWSNAVSTKPAFRGIILQKGSEGTGGYGFFHSNRSGDLDPESGRATLGSPLP